MRIEITKHFTFEAAHRLPKVPTGHKCGRMHGHSYKVTLVLACDETALRDGMVVDYADIAKAWRRLHACLDHRTLNKIEGLENPTTEVLAPWIYGQLRTLMIDEDETMRRVGDRLVRVIVKESGTTTCTYPVA